MDTGSNGSHCSSKRLLIREPITMDQRAYNTINKLLLLSAKKKKQFSWLLLQKNYKKVPWIVNQVKIYMDNREDRKEQAEVQMYFIYSVCNRKQRVRLHELACTTYTEYSLNNDKIMFTVM